MLGNSVVPATAGYEYHHNKHYECDECGKHFVKLGQLYDHVRATKHMCVRCLHCGCEITTWKDRLSHFAHMKHALLDGPIFTAEVKNEPPNPQFLEPVAFKSDWADSDDEDTKEEFPPGWWDDENEVLIGIILSFRPNGTTTSKGLQKVLSLSYMSSMLKRIISTDGSLDAFLKRHKQLFQSEPMYKLRLKLPREETIKNLVLLTSRPQIAMKLGAAAGVPHPGAGDQLWFQQGSTKRSPFKVQPKDATMLRGDAAAASTSLSPFASRTPQVPPAAHMEGAAAAAAAVHPSASSSAAAPPKWARDAMMMLDSKRGLPNRAHLPALGEVPRPFHAAGNPLNLRASHSGAVCGQPRPQTSHAGHPGVLRNAISTQDLYSRPERPDLRSLRQMAASSNQLYDMIPDDMPADHAGPAPEVAWVGAPVKGALAKGDARGMVAAKADVWAAGMPAAAAAAAAAKPDPFADGMAAVAAGEGERDTWLPKFLELWQQLVQDDESPE